MKRLLLIGLALIISACSGGGWQALVVPATTVRGFAVERPRVKGTKKPVEEMVGDNKGPASFIEKVLHRKGLVFGTDGSAQALHAYLSEKFPRLSAREATPGDIIVFDLGQGCGGHVGMVIDVDSIGRISFREQRDGSMRESQATPSLSNQRRDERGKILNTFLRPKRMDDLIGTRYFAGEMICALFRVP
jgi:hypothetical protein